MYCVGIPHPVSFTADVSARNGSWATPSRCCSPAVLDANARCLASGVVGVADEEPESIGELPLHRSRMALAD